MRIHVLTVFPKLIKSPIHESMIKRAQQKKLVQIKIHDLRKYTEDKHHTVDDRPYGGGPGMVLKPEPIFRCVEAIQKKEKKIHHRIILLSPQGKPYSQKIANELSEEKSLILICGHYKGVDERVREHLADEEISIGDYVLTGGELPALIIIDTVIRLLPGVLGDLDSAVTDSFQDGYLDSPLYTRPEDFRGWQVPEVLITGNHKKIEEWRLTQRIQQTELKRKDLINHHKN
jgi:tRNA (guanine37-N1)-methyltransferase